MAQSKDDSALYPVAIGVVIAAMVVGFAWLPRVLASTGTTSEGRDAPDFHVKLVANAETLAVPPQAPPEAISLADVSGHPVILDFWATWCGPCRAQAPIVDKVSQRYHDKGLIVVGINTSDEDGLAAPFARREGLSYPIAFDPGPAAHAYGADALPTLVVISRTGKIVAVRQGVTDAAELERLVDKAL
jgi:cytochrome c biogenesis protein CcmG, thiol:disulfide interchange protein DsbE